MVLFKEEKAHWTQMTTRLNFKAEKIFNTGFYFNFNNLKNFKIGI